MKRIRIPLEHIWTWANLERALGNALRGKRQRADARAFLDAMPGSLVEVGRRLRTGAGPVGDFTEFTIRDPKERLISAPCFPDRVLHHAVMNLAEQPLERYQVYHSYACRRGRGQFAAIRQAERNAARARFFLKMDIRKYFQSVDRATLIGMLTRRFEGRGMAELWWKLLESWLPGEPCGLAIGSLISQHLGNFYLAPMDHWMLEQPAVRGYARYMDDFVAWSDDQGALRQLREKTRFFLAERLKLDLKPPHINRTGHGMDFLGYRVFPWGSRLARASKRRFRRKWAALSSTMVAGEIGEIEAQARMTALTAFTERAACKRFRSAVLFGGERPQAPRPVPTG